MSPRISWTDTAQAMPNAALEQYLILPEDVTIVQPGEINDSTSYGLSL